jgi:hypothetical protein
MFKSSNSFVGYEYSLIASAMEKDSPNKRYFLLILFLLGLPLMPSKLHAFVLSETISNVWSNMWSGVT